MFVICLSHTVYGICYRILSRRRHSHMEVRGHQKPSQAWEYATFLTGRFLDLLDTQVLYWCLSLDWQEQSVLFLAGVTEKRKFGLEILKNVLFDSKGFKFFSYDFFGCFFEMFTFISFFISANQFQNNIKCGQFLLVLSFLFCFIQSHGSLWSKEATSSFHTSWRHGSFNFELEDHWGQIR